MLYSFAITKTTYAQGTVIDDNFFSVSLDTTRMVDVYLPEGYTQDDTTRHYPVVYFLHGAKGNQNSYESIESILNSLISNNSIDPVIMVKPDGSIGPWSGSMYTNSDLYGLFEEYIVHDLVSYIDSTYNTLKTREKRCIMGHSMGGYGAMKLALKHPELFGAVAAHSGSLNFIPFLNYIPMVLAENGGSGPFNPDAGTLTNLMFTMAGAWSPNMNNPPYFVDLFIDNKGLVIDTTWNKWLLQSPAHFATQYSQQPEVAIYFDCGQQDEFGVFPMNTLFADNLDSLGIPYEFQEYSGTHSNKLYERFNISLEFLNSKMKSPVTVAYRKNTLPVAFVMHQNYPNPFNSTTIIRYDLLKPSHVILKIYDSIGREVKVLVNNFEEPGFKSVQWNSKNNFGLDVSTGIYMYLIQCDDYSQGGKMILIK
ncbi:MAG: prolyl oligopeptidase family serine peptidase [bacterium]|nr:MAG: prolyl oligopeptidase family serine peptidase [bacterium]